MGNKNSGRRPHPSAIKLLRGRKDRINPHEPTLPRASDAFDAPPLELAGDAVATAEWARVVPLLRRVGLVSESERAALIALCQMWSRYCAVHARVRAESMVLDTERGPMVNPLIGIQDKVLAHLMKLWAELGLTPSGRSRLSALPDPDPPTPSKWAGIL